MAGCKTARNIQKYKGSGGTASTLQEALENSNTATVDINLISGAKFIGDGSALTGIAGTGGGVGNLQQVTDQHNSTTNTVDLTNTGTSLTTSGTIISSGNITAPSFIGSGTSLTGIALAIDTSSNAARVSVLETDLTSNVSRVGVLETGLTSNASRVSVLETKLTSNAARVGVLETDLTSNVSRVSELETDLTSNTARVGVLETDLTSNTARVGVLETDLTSNSTRIGTVSTDLASNSTRIGNVSTDLASNSIRIGTVSTDLASNSTRISTVSTDLADNSTRISTVSTDLADNSTRISTVSTNLADNSTRINTVSTNLADNSTRINTVSTNLASNAGRITTIETDLASNSTRIGTVNTNLASNVGRITTVETNLADNSTRINTVSTNLASNVLRIGTLESEVQPVNRGGTGQTSYNVGEILVANDPNSTGTPTLHKLPAGSSGYFLKSTGNGSFPTWGDVSSVGSATPGQLFTGVGLTGANAISDGNTPPTFTGGHTGAGDTTISVDSATGNVASKLVMRDTSGDIFVSNVNAIRINGDGTFLTGVALSTDLSSNSTRIGNLESNLAANVTRIGNLESNLAANVIRIGNLENSTIISNSSGITNAFETGDLIYASGQNTLSNLSIGSLNQVLTVSGGIPAWVAPSGGGGGHWTQHANGNDIYYSSGNVGISNTAPTNTFSVGTVVSIQETTTGDVLIVRGNGYFNDDVYIAKRLTIPVGGELKADTIKVRSMSQKGTLVVAERLVDTISLG